MWKLMSRWLLHLCCGRNPDQRCSPEVDRCSWYIRKLAAIKVNKEAEALLQMCSCSVSQRFSCHIRVFWGWWHLFTSRQCCLTMTFFILCLVCSSYRLMNWSFFFILAELGLTSNRSSQYPLYPANLYQHHRICCCPSSSPVSPFVWRG